MKLLDEPGFKVLKLRLVGLVFVTIGTCLALVSIPSLYFWSTMACGILPVGCAFILLGTVLYCISRKMDFKVNEEWPHRICMVMVNPMERKMSCNNEYTPEFTFSNKNGSGLGVIAEDDVNRYEVMLKVPSVQTVEE